MNFAMIEKLLGNYLLFFPTLGLEHPRCYREKQILLVVPIEWVPIVIVLIILCYLLQFLGAAAEKEIAPARADEEFIISTSLNNIIPINLLIPSMQAYKTN